MITVIRIIIICYYNMSCIFANCNFRQHAFWLNISDLRYRFPQFFPLIRGVCHLRQFSWNANELCLQILKWKTLQKRTLLSIGHLGTNEHLQRPSWPQNQIQIVIQSFRSLLLSLSITVTFHSIFHFI